MTISALDVARAALMEVGADPDRVSLYHGVIATERGDAVAARAALLGIAARSGMDYIVRCSDCDFRWTTRTPCTPVRDVLRGVRCGR